MSILAWWFETPPIGFGSVRRFGTAAMQAHIGTYNNMPALHSTAQTYARTMAPERPTAPFSRPAPALPYQKTPFERPAPQRPPYRTFPRTRPPAREN